MWEKHVLTDRTSLLGEISVSTSNSDGNLAIDVANDNSFDVLESFFIYNIECIDTRKRPSWSASLDDFKARWRMIHLEKQLWGRWKRLLKCVVMYTFLTAERALFVQYKTQDGAKKQIRNWDLCGVCVFWWNEYWALKLSQCDGGDKLGS